MRVLAKKKTLHAVKCRVWHLLFAAKDDTLFLISISIMILILNFCRRMNHVGIGYAFIKGCG